jgi:DNA-binding NtrC family response regulator
MLPEKTGSMTEKHHLVFIVEDNEMYSLLLDYTLSHESVCRCMSFKSGEECIANLHLNPMIVILDYNLPGMNGIETLRQIRKLNKEVPVVLLTGNEDVDAAREFLNEGVYYYLIKGENTVAELEYVIDTAITRNANKEVVKSNKVADKMIFGVILAIVVIVALAYLLLF